MTPSEWFLGFIVILLLIGLPSIIFSLLSSLFFIAMNKVRVKLVRLILPPVIFIVIGVILSAAGPGLEMLYKTMGFVAVISWLLFGAIIAMGIITPFPLFERRLPKTKSWIYVFEASIITFFYLFVAEVANQAGLMRVVSRVSPNAYSPIVFLPVLFIEAVVIASLVYGGFTLYYHFSWKLASE
ncbi:MAG: hypothetical protein QHG97_01300 [Methanolinea sp.]|nr:hypothetical protein [Methanolinea sp.]